MVNPMRKAYDRSDGQKLLLTVKISNFQGLEKLLTVAEENQVYLAYVFMKGGDADHKKIRRMFT